MDTIQKHAPRLVQRYVRSANAEEVINSAIELAKLVLESPNLIKRHKKKILSDVQWLISEVDGKYTTRYRSKEVVDLANNDPTSGIKIQHEHVFARKAITEGILHDQPNVANILRKLVACVVTKSEHDRLTGPAYGWQRYANANIQVYDMLSNPPKIIDWPVLLDPLAHEI